MVSRWLTFGWLSAAIQRDIKSAAHLRISAITLATCDITKHTQNCDSGSVLCSGGFGSPLLYRIPGVRKMLSTCTHRTWTYNQEMQTALFATRTYTVEKKPTNIEEMQYREFLHSILPTINANRTLSGYKPWTFGALRMFLLRRGYGTVHHQHLQLLWNRCSDAEVPVRAWFARLK